MFLPSGELSAYSIELVCDLYSWQDLEVYGVLQLTSIAHQFHHFLLALVLHDDLGEVLAEDAGFLFAKVRPQVLNERVGKGEEALPDAVLQVDVEVVLFDTLTVVPKLFLHILRKLAHEGDLRRFDHDVQCHLDPL